MDLDGLKCEYVGQDTAAVTSYRWTLDELRLAKLAAARRADEVTDGLLVN
jgi:hypothetical protein